MPKKKKTFTAREVTKIQNEKLFWLVEGIGPAIEDLEERIKELYRDIKYLKKGFIDEIIKAKRRKK